jgi:tetratricopeptide (TPR) repeat protein
MLVVGAVDTNDHRPISCKIYFKISHGSGILRKFQEDKEQRMESGGNERRKAEGERRNLDQEMSERDSLAEVTDAKTGLARVFLIAKGDSKDSKEYVVEFSSPNQAGIVEPFRILCADKKLDNPDPDELLKIAKLESERAERFERDGRLYEALRSWERAIEIMFPTHLSSPIYQQTMTKYARIQARFDQLLEHEYNLARIAFEQGNMSDSLGHLEEIRNYLPNKNDPRYLKAKERVLTISQIAK